MTQKLPKIMIVVGSLSRGGCETHLVQILPRLSEIGYDVSVFLLDFPGPLAERMEAGGVKLILPTWQSDRSRTRSTAIKTLRLGFTGARLFAALWARRPDVVHFFLPASYLIGGPISLMVPGIKRIMSRRSLNDYQEKYPPLRTVELFLHQRMHAVLGNSNAVLQQLIHDEKVPVDRAGLIYNGVVSDRYGHKDRDNLRRALGIAPNTIVLSVVANLIPYKGHLDLLQALGQIQFSANCDWRLFLAGRDDGHGIELRQRSQELGLSDKVVYLGEYQRVHRLLAASDIFVLPSHEEGFSNALLEAMSAGLAVIATDVGGNPEAVEDKVSGLIVPSRDPRNLGLAISRLAGSGSERRRLGTAARERVLREFSVERCTSQYDLLYRSLMRGDSLPNDVSFHQR